MVLLTETYGKTRIYDSSGVEILFASRKDAKPLRGIEDEIFLSLRPCVLARNKKSVSFARMYDPEIGRFLQTDPLGYIDTINPYAYCGNNPANWIDPTGLWTVKIRIAAGFGGAVEFGRNSGQWSLVLAVGPGLVADFDLDLGDSGESAFVSGGITAEAGVGAGILASAAVVCKLNSDYKKYGSDIADLSVPVRLGLITKDLSLDDPDATPSVSAPLPKNNPFKLGWGASVMVDIKVAWE